ncbi:MAG: DNA repair protein RadA [Hyphomicrobiales bacterium]|nr:DNA repair protein RadA [Hyphomicrobiales bacterium]MDE2017400.1 DNA repair protein RadA [Hyphomicrobiales bacterium]
MSLAAKSRNAFVCQACGAVSKRWQGKCESCGGWNTIVEETGFSGVGAASMRRSAPGRPVALESLAGEGVSPPRIESGIGELDRVAGGGFVPGSVILLGGEPGVGKSTLLIEACAAMARRGRRVIYVSGEEAVAQVRLRARRLGLADAAVELAAETCVENVAATLREGAPPAFVVVDSIQTMWTDAVESAPGSVAQVRAAAQALIACAKAGGAAIVLVGHVTKDGQIAGPRVVEHMVDAVLSFEGDAAHRFRLLRASKNRFGPTDEIGVFEMTGRGLAEVLNPSSLFLAGRDSGAPGAAVFAGMEGARPVLVEFQALVAPSTLGTPRRAVVGWDGARLAMVLAVLEARAGLRLGGHDVYLSVAGGLRVSEPAADLAAAAALVSALTGSPLPADAVHFGEIGLSGAVRPAIHAGARMREAAKLGFARAVAPPMEGEAAETPLRHVTVTQVAEIVAEIAGTSVRDDEAARDG